MVERGLAIHLVVVTMGLDIARTGQLPALLSVEGVQYHKSQQTSTMRSWHKLISTVQNLILRKGASRWRLAALFQQAAQRHSTGPVTLAPVTVSTGHPLCLQQLLGSLAIVQILTMHHRIWHRQMRVTLCTYTR